MYKTIEVEVGDFYSELYEHYSESVGGEYTGRAREQFEDFLHKFNKTVESE